MTKKNYDELARQILLFVGSKENVTHVFHCITRLRFELKDKDLVEIERLKKLPGVIGALWSGDQLQVVIGNAVSEVYKALCNLGGFETAAQVSVNLDRKRQFSLNTLFETLSACIVPVIPAMCGSGLIKGILIALTTYGLIDTSTGLYIVLNAIGDATFYYLPFLVSFSAAKKFNTNPVLAMVLAGLYLHPTIAALAKQDISVLGIPMHILNYSSTVFPIVLSVYVMSFVHHFFESKIPSAVRMVFAPLFTLFIMALLSLGLIGPIGYYIGFYLAQAINWLFGIAPALAGAILGAIRPLVILTGMQTVFSPLIANNIAVMGYDVISPVHTAATMAAAGICLGAFIKAKNRDDKNSYLSFFISAFIGITEPALYGLAFRYKNILVSLITPK